MEWPKNISISELRGLILERLNKHGEPIRWAITNIKKSEKLNSIRSLKIEAILINSQD